MEKGLINLLRTQEPAFKRSHFVHTCGSAAWSRGFRVFAVHNESECFGYSDVSATLPRLNVSLGCLGGKGGRNVTDVYRFTSKEILPWHTFACYHSFIQSLSQSLTDLFIY